MEVQTMQSPVTSIKRLFQDCWDFRIPPSVNYSQERFGRNHVTLKILGQAEVRKMKVRLKGTRKMGNLWNTVSQLLSFLHSLMNTAFRLLHSSFLISSYEGRHSSLLPFPQFKNRKKCRKWVNHQNCREVITLQLSMQSVLEIISNLGQPFIVSKPLPQISLSNNDG